MLWLNHIYSEWAAIRVFRINANIRFPLKANDQKGIYFHSQLHIAHNDTLPVFDRWNVLEKGWKKHFSHCVNNGGKTEGEKIKMKSDSR